MQLASKRSAWKTLLAFAVIYFVWGCTFLAIRVGVQEIPPLLYACLRFSIAGFVLLCWTIARGERLPLRREWASVFLLAFLIFVVDYGLLFWAEQRVPSGIAAVILATIPLFIALGEILFMRTERMTLRLALALFTGLAGVAILMDRSFRLGGSPVDRKGALALITASMSWSIASTLTRKVPLPGSKMMSSGAQMLAGGVLLAIAAAGVGEFGRFHPSAVSARAWLSLAYLIVAGSIVGFTAYIWLIHHQSPTKVGTYAYVNPIVAVLVGRFAGGEALGLRTAVGTSCVLISVLLITTKRVRKAEPVPEVQSEETRPHDLKA